MACNILSIVEFEPLQVQVHVAFHIQVLLFMAKLSCSGDSILVFSVEQHQLHLQLSKSGLEVSNPSVSPSPGA